MNAANEQAMKANADKKGRTWGPSSVHQKRSRRSNRTRIYSDNNGRASSFPNLGILDRNLIDSTSAGDLSKSILIVYAL